MTNIIECLGITTHHLFTICLVVVCFIFAGWGCTALLYLLDAAGEENGEWVRLTSKDDMLTLNDKSRVLLLIGVVGMCASWFQNTLSDKVGRVPVMRACVLFGALGAISTALVRTKSALIFSVMLNPFIRDGMCVTSSSLLAEWLPLKWRSVMIVILHVFWNVGRFLVSVLWVVLPPEKYWRSFFHVAAVLPVALAFYLGTRGWRYESPRWLAATGRTEDCIDMLRLAVESDGGRHSLPRSWDDPTKLLVESTSGEEVKVKERSMQEHFSELCGPELRGRLIVIGAFHMFLSFASGAMFMWLMAYLKKVNAEDAIAPSMIAAPIAKCLADLSLVVGGPERCLLDRVPRLRIMQLGGVCYGCSVLLLLTTTKAGLVTALVFIANFSEELMWTIHLYTIEAFPTDVRNSAFGLMCVFGSIGGITSTSLCGLLLEMWVYLPMGLIVVFSFLAGLLSLLLQEDVCHATLSDTVTGGAYGSIEEEEGVSSKLS